MDSLYASKRDHPFRDTCITRIAAAQHGVFTREQAVACGASKTIISWRLRERRWERIFPGVFRLAGVPPTWMQRCVAACLHWDPGAFVSHRTAAALGGLGLQRSRIHVTALRGTKRTSARDIIVHTTRLIIPSEDLTKIRGIPVSRPARTLLDLAATESERLAGNCLDESLRRTLVSLAFLERWLDDPQKRRHGGTKVLRRLIDERATIGVTGSPLEAKFLRALRDAALPIPRLQFVVMDGDELVGQVDFAYPEQKVAIECDSFRFHDRRTTFDSERARGNALEALGWRVLRITDRHLESNLETVVEWVRRTLSHAA